MTKPFVLGATPVFVGGARNSFKILFPFVSSMFKDPQVMQKYSAELDALRDALVSPFIMGKNADLVLALAIRTTKLPEFPYLPVQSASWSGFNANVRLQNAKASILSLETQTSLIETTLGSGNGTEPSSIVEAESAAIEPSVKKETRKKEGKKDSPKSQEEGNISSSP
jgi:hypothetical protein